MRRFYTVMTAAFVVVAFSSLVSAQAANTAKSTDKKTEKTVTKTEKVEKVEALTATGKVEKVDDSGKKFTIKTKEGDKEFTLAAEAKITAGAKTEKAEEMKGKNVKVTYTVVDGKNVASKVAVAAETKPAPKSEEKKK
jgi:hypothetical protein